MTRGELREKILWRLNQDVTTPQFWEEDYINRLIDEANMNFISRTRVLETSTTLSLIAYQNLYKFAANCFIINRMYYSTTDRIIEPVSWSALVNHDPSWSTTNGPRPDYWTFIPPNNIFLYPSVTADADDAVLYHYTKMPADFANDAAKPDIPSIFHDALIEYPLALAFLRMGSASYLKKAYKYWSLYKDKITSLKKLASNRSTRRIRVRARF